MSTAVESSEDTFPPPLTEPSTQVTYEEPDNSSSGNGVVVKVTQHPLDRPLNSASDGCLLQPQGGRATPADLLADDMAKGLSCLSLEVMTSGEHLDALSSMDDLSSDDLGSGSGRGSSPGCASGMGEEEGLDRGSSPGCVSMEEEERARGSSASVEEEGRGRGSSPGSASMEEERESRDLQVNVETKREEQGKREGEDGVLCKDEKSPNDVITAVVEVSCPASSGNSRSSSSMGYLEPRPPAQPSSNGGEQVFSPKDIQKKLMDKVANLNTSTPPDSEGVVEKAEPGGGASTISTSTSSHSLNSGAGSSKGISFGSFFKRRRSLAGKRNNPETLAATSTSGLILHDRPKTLPAKNPAEEHRHQRLHQQMMAAARKKELQKAKEEVKREKMKRERDKLVADSLVEWEKILLKWESMYRSRKVRELWWNGLPPGVRGKVWKKAIGNDLNISPDLYAINLRRCKERLASARERSDSKASQSSLSREQSVEVIHLDVLRTFPTLGFFQEGGPYNQSLRDVLGAYACYRPDIGYVQGMSFLAGVLLLNMEAGDAFVCLANLLNRPSYLAFFKVDHSLMHPYFSTFNILLQDSLPKLSAHFSRFNFSPEYYLIEWIFTIYTRVLPLDVACRVWDMFCRDGDSFLFRTALGILRQFQSNLLEFVSIEDMGQFLGHLPSTMDSDLLFMHIDAVHFNTKRFWQILAQEQAKPFTLT